MTAPYTGRTGTLPSLPRLLSPDEYDQAAHLGPEQLAQAKFPVIPPPIAPRDATAGMNPKTGKDERSNPNPSLLTGPARLLTQYVAGPMLDNPLTTALTTVAPGAAPVMAGLMGKDLTEYAAQKAAELTLPPDIRKQAEADPSRISGEQAAMEAGMLAIGPVIHAGVKALRGEAAGEVAKVATDAAGGPASPQQNGPTSQHAIELAAAGGERFSGIPVSSELRARIDQHMADVADAFNTIVAPANRSPEAKQAANILRATTGEQAAKYEQASFKLDEFRRAIDPLPDADKFAFIDAVEGGRSQPNPEFQKPADTIRQILDDARQAVQDLGTGKLDHFIEDYFPHIWTDPARAKDAFEAAKIQTGGKRPMEGGKSFLKERTVPTTAEGLRMGLTPVSSNPVDLTLLKLREMQRYVMAHQSLQEMQGQGLVKLVRAGEPRPDGYARINDNIATVFGPKSGGVTLPEGASVVKGAPPPIPQGESLARYGPTMYHETSIDRALALLDKGTSEDLAPKSLFVSDTPDLALGQGKNTGVVVEFRGDALRGEQHTGKPGLAFSEQQGGREFVARNNKQSAYQDAVQAFTIKPAAKASLGAYAKRFRNSVLPALEKEGWTKTALADGSVRYERPAATTSVTPLAPEDVGVLGRRVMGEYWAPEPVARVVNNYLSPGLRGNALYDAYRGLGNALNQAQLGLSGFHLMFTSMDASVSRMALGLEYLGSGKAAKGLSKIASTPLAPVTNVLFGKKIRAAYLNPEKATPEMQALVNAVKEAGGRVRMDSFYQNSAPEKFTKALREGAYGKAAGYSLPALIETFNKPLMEHIVPMQKLGVFGDLATKVLADLPPEASLADRRAALAKAWDSVDNRMGQLVYDNLFWNKTFKDLSMASVRSVGWNIGTIRELGGGIKDVAAMGKSAAKGQRMELSHRAAYIAALPMTVGLYGAAYQYLRTGEGPEELKDYFFPKTGDVDADGNPERVQIASYMKDVFAYAGDPFQTVKHKASPILSTLYEMLQNEDFYGDQIRNPHDPFVTQLAQEAKYVAETALPFSLRNMQESAKRGDHAGTQIGQWFGITPAPRTKVRSDAQNRMMEYLAQRQMSGATPEDAEARQQRQTILAGLRGTSGVDVGQAVTDAIEHQQLAPKDVVRLLRLAGSTPAQEKFKRLTMAQALDVFQRSTPREQAMFAQALMAKMQNFAAQ